MLSKVLMQSKPLQEILHSSNNYQADPSDSYERLQGDLGPSLLRLSFRLLQAVSCCQLRPATDAVLRMFVEGISAKPRSSKLPLHALPDLQIKMDSNNACSSQTYTAVVSLKQYSKSTCFTRQTSQF